MDDGKAKVGEERVEKRCQRWVFGVGGGRAWREMPGLREGREGPRPVQVERESGRIPCLGPDVNVRWTCQWMKTTETINF
jgi:hypothetical protein